MKESTDRKWEALAKTVELDEQAAMSKKAQVLEVFEKRQTNKMELEAKIIQRKKLISQERQKKRSNAFCSGDISNVLAYENYERRLSFELDEMHNQMKLCDQELDSALERLKIAEEDLIHTRIEKKKIEKFMEKRALNKRINQEAVEESEQDEQASVRKFE